MSKLAGKGRRETESRSESLKQIGKSRSIAPLRTGNKYIGGDCRVNRPSDENSDDSIGDCEPSHEHSHEKGVAFAAQQHQMPFSESHHVQPQHIGNHKNLKNCESPPSLSSSQNAVFAFPSRSQSSEAIAPQQSSTFFGSCADNTSSGANFERNFSPKVQEDRRSNQQKKYHTDNCALETMNDKIDDDALSAWWFLGSKSDSFEDASERKREIEPNDMDAVQCQRENSERKTTNEFNKRSEVTLSWILRSFSSEKSPSMNVGSIESLGSVHSPSEFADRKSPSTYIQRTNPTLSKDESKGVGKAVRSSMQTSQSHGTSQSSKGGGYTSKEQRIRKEWLVAIGVTVNYDTSALEDSGDAPYQLVLPQKSPLQIDTKSSMCNDPSKSPDWDPSLLQTNQIMKNSYFEDWTPQDSSYGAAVPAFGWIPKRIRKLIEILFLLLVTAVLIYVVVKLGIILIGNEHSSSSGGELIIWNDDDHYIANNANNNMNQGAVDDNEWPNRLRI
ncbi:hypothetical protein ACHAW6_002340 [Cyclotella cf. meneghiniana]